MLSANNFPFLVSVKIFSLRKNFFLKVQLIFFQRFYVKIIVRHIPLARSSVVGMCRRTKPEIVFAIPVTAVVKSKPKSLSAESPAKSGREGLFLCFPEIRNLVLN